MTITLKVPEMSADDRRALEHVLGQSLREDQQLVIKIETASPIISVPKDTPGEVPELPPWCKIFDDLSEEEFLELQAAMLRPVHFGKLPSDES